MSDLTVLLRQVREGDATALQQIFTRLYGELRRLAGARLRSGENTLTPTVLVNEIYLRLAAGGGLDIQDRQHFFACASRAMRAVVIDHARRACAGKRGGPGRDVDLDAIVAPALDFPEQLLALDSALEELETINSRQHQVVELHYFAGLGYAEIGVLLACDERTAKREWQRGRAFLYSRIAP